eukprot:m.134391 g.134391  ORF g.134391 m.134391 type:complete len:124 (-) comp22529_c0_seq1:941-1312(-)
MNIGSQDQWELEDNHPLHMMHWCVANCVRTTNTGRCAFHLSSKLTAPNFEQLNPDSDSIAVRSGQFLKCTPVLLIIGANLFRFASLALISSWRGDLVTLPVASAVFSVFIDRASTSACAGTDL